MAELITEKQRLEAKSDDYDAMWDYWSRVSDIFQGEEAIIKAATKYLPVFPNEHEDNYNFRKSLAKFTNIFRDMVEGLASKPFEQEVQLTEPKSPPEQLSEFIDDVDGSGNNISVFSMDTFFNGIGYAIEWIFVDYSRKADDVVRSVAEEQALGLRPFWSHVLCTNVYEVKSAVIGGKEQLTYFRLFEPANGAHPKQFREMFYENGFASFKIWIYNKVKDDYELGDEGKISIGIIPMVPFITGRRKGKSFQFFPPMKDAADLQIKLYRAESNLEHTKTVAAFPMLVGQGVKPEIKGGKIVPVPVGPGVALYAPATGDGTQTDWKYIEPAGSTLTFLKEDTKDIKQDLRELGRQPLTVNSGNLTTITTAVAAGKSKSAVKTWGIGLTDALTLALDYTCRWMNIAVEPSVKVYDEYDDLLEPGADAQMLLSAASQGKLSTATLWNEWQRRKILSSEFDPEKEKEAILAEVPNEPTTPNGV